MFLFSTMLSASVSGCGWQQFLDQDSAHERLFESKTKAFQERLEANGHAVQAKEDLSAGEEVKSEKLNEVDMELYRIPIDAVSSTLDANGKKLKHDVLAGQVICRHDLILPLSKSDKNMKQAGAK